MNAGRSWTPVFDAQSVASIGAIGVAPSNPNVVYVGTGECDMRDSISFGDGMYKSIDGGNTWKHIGLDATRQIGRVLVDPRNPDAVFVAALGHAYGPSPDRGVYRSRDGGTTWQKVLFKGDGVGAIDLAIDRPTRRPYTPRSGLRAGRLGTSTIRPSVPAAAFSSPPMVARHGSSSRPGCRVKASGGPALLSRLQMPGESMRLLTQRTAAYTAPKMPEIPGARSLGITGFGDAVGISARSRSIRRTRTSSTCRTHRSINQRTRARAGLRSKAHPEEMTIINYGSHPKILTG